MTFPGLTDRRARLMLATLGFLRLDSQLSPVLHALHRWLDSWRGIGDITVGMAHQGYDLQLTRYGERGWRATFYPTGMEHSLTSATASAWEPTPWRAVQGAARRIGVLLVLLSPAGKEVQAFRQGLRCWCARTRCSNSGCSTNAANS